MASRKSKLNWEKAFLDTALCMCIGLMAMVVDATPRPKEDVPKPEPTASKSAPPAPPSSAPQSTKVRGKGKEKKEKVTEARLVLQLDGIHLKIGDLYYKPESPDLEELIKNSILVLKVTPDFVKSAGEKTGSYVQDTLASLDNGVAEKVELELSRD